MGNWQYYGMMVMDYNVLIGKWAIMQRDDNWKLAWCDGKMGNSNT